jgi:formylglycine-generating enzyme required for sulfatase activity
MVLIPAGRFRMGQIPNEVPLHYVNITKPFYMSKFEITQGQWKEVLEHYHILIIIRMNCQ